LAPKTASAEDVEMEGTPLLEVTSTPLFTDGVNATLLEVAP
jgi:hypothetical protein